MDQITSVSSIFGRSGPMPCCSRIFRGGTLPARRYFTPSPSDVW